MKIKGSKDDLIELLKSFYLGKGMILNNIKIASGGNWSGIAKDTPNTIDGILEEMYSVYPEEKRNISHLKRILTRYLSAQSANTKRPEELHYGLAWKRALDCMANGDAQVLKSIKEENYLAISGVGRKTWELLQKIIKNHL